MSGLRYSKLLIPVLVVAVLAGTATNFLLQRDSNTTFSPASMFFILPVSMLSQIGIIAIIWSVALKWPVAGGIIMLLLGVAVFDGVLAYFDGRMTLSNHNPVLLVLLIALVVLYAVAGVMLLLSKRVIKSGAAS
jgi:peptidoglycan/LPS O-acetylase OafA/YrhL